MTGQVVTDRVGSVARITLNRPEAGNAIIMSMARSLLDAAVICDEDPSVRCVLLTGAGRMFCVGGDVAAFGEQGEELPAYVKKITTYLHSALIRLARMKKPIVTAINGPAAGAGIGLAIIGDIALSAPEAHFTLAYTAIGMSPDAGATWLLPRLVGMRRAQELLLLNSRITAAEAASIGLITRVVASGSVVAEAAVLAERLATGATSAFGTSRQLLLQSLETSFEAQLGAERLGIAAQARKPDGREGIAAFLDKRMPIFPGA